MNTPQIQRFCKQRFLCFEAKIWNISRLCDSYPSPNILGTSSDFFCRLQYRKDFEQRLFDPTHAMKFASQVSAELLPHCFASLELKRTLSLLKGGFQSGHVCSLRKDLPFKSWIILGSLRDVALRQLLPQARHRFLRSFSKINFLDLDGPFDSQIYVIPTVSTPLLVPFVR